MNSLFQKSEPLKGKDKPQLLVKGSNYFEIMGKYYDILKDITISGSTFKDFRDSFCYIRQDGTAKIVTFVKFVPFSTGINSYTQYGDSNQFDYPSTMTDELILEDVILRTYGETETYRRRDFTVKVIDLY